MSDEVPRKLTPKEAAGMTVNERLFLSGLLERYEKAVAAWDVDEISEVLKSIYLNTETIDAIIQFELERK
jgi:hypothetical protein